MYKEYTIAVSSLQQRQELVLDPWSTDFGEVTGSLWPYRRSFRVSLQFPSVPSDTLCLIIKNIEPTSSIVRFCVLPESYITFSLPLTWSQLQSPTAGWSVNSNLSLAIALSSETAFKSPNLPFDRRFSPVFPRFRLRPVCIAIVPPFLELSRPCLKSSPCPLLLQSPVN
jgi:hypothetical protein